MLAACASPPVCRRQNTVRIGLIVGIFRGLRLHGFGVKTSGLHLYGPSSPRPTLWP